MDAARSVYFDFYKVINNRSLENDCWQSQLSTKYENSIFFFESILYYVMNTFCTMLISIQSFINITWASLILSLESRLQMTTRMNGYQEHVHKHHLSVSYLTFITLDSFELQCLFQGCYSPVVSILIWLFHTWAIFAFSKSTFWTEMSPQLNDLKKL